MVEYYKYNSDFEFFNYVLDCMICIIESIYDFFHEVNFWEYLLKYCISNKRPQLWPVVDHVSIYPPIMRRVIGCPKKLKNKANDETKNHHVLSRRLATVTCKKSGEMGHYKKSCKSKK